MIDNPIAGIRAIQRFLYDRSIKTPDHIQDKLLDIIDPTKQSSPVQAACEAAEYIYARRDEAPPELLEIGAQLASMAADFKLFGMGIDGRGYAIAATIRAMDTVASEPPPASVIEPPEPKAEHVRAAPQPEPSPGP